MDNPRIWGTTRLDCSCRAVCDLQNVNSAWDSVRETWRKATFVDSGVQTP